LQEDVEHTGQNITNDDHEHGKLAAGPDMAATSIEIRLQGISATFHHEKRGDITAVKNLDLDVKPGEFLTLLGSSGCGKTTTLRMIADSRNRRRAHSLW